jgi:hypothetical protein
MVKWVTSAHPWCIEKRETLRDIAVASYSGVLSTRALGDALLNSYAIASMIFWRMFIFALISFAGYIALVVVLVQTPLRHGSLSVVSVDACKLIVLGKVFVSRLASRSVVAGPLSVFKLFRWRFVG